MYTIRPLCSDDYHKFYLQLLEQLSILNPSNISFEEFEYFVSNLSPNHQILVVENAQKTHIIGTVTVILEPKIIHDLSYVCHIEDVVVDNTVRGKGLGSFLMEEAYKISKRNNCYKTILDCSDENKQFYAQCGFKQQGICMRK